MNLVKTKRVKLKGKSAKEFYNAIYERDGGMCVWCGAPIEYGVKHHHEPCGIYKSDEKEKAVMLCPACHHRRHFQDAAEGETVCREYLQSLYGEKGGKERMKFIDFFAGIGGFHSGLEKAGMECIGWCEFDKFAQKSYRAMYNTERLWFADDVRKVRGWDLPKADLWTFGFPCQDVSIAGKQKGIKRGTRSGLFYEIMRLVDEAEENRPEWLICENVKNLLSIDRGRGFFTVLTEMGGARVHC